MPEDKEKSTLQTIKLGLLLLCNDQVVSSSDVAFNRDLKQVRGPPWGIAGGGTGLPGIRVLSTGSDS